MADTPAPATPDEGFAGPLAGMVASYAVAYETYAEAFARRGFADIAADLLREAADLRRVARRAADNE